MVTSGKLDFIDPKTNAGPAHENTKIAEIRSFVASVGFLESGYFRLKGSIYLGVDLQAQGEPYRVEEQGRWKGYPLHPSMRWPVFQGRNGDDAPDT